MVGDHRETPVELKFYVVPHIGVTPLQNCRISKTEKKKRGNSMSILGITNVY